MTDYVIDTCILVEANNDNKERAFTFMRLLFKLEDHRICLDNKREILKEYERNDIYKEFSGIWFKNMHRAAKILYVKKEIEKRQRKDLIKLRFDTDDIKFVATANACGKRIISNDTDYTAVIVQYLWEEMGIIILHPNSELE